jgi:periplasmic mercuric ion binding protein
MKKTKLTFIASLFIVIALSFTIFSCGKSDTKTSEKKETTQINEQNKAGNEEVTVNLPTIQCNTCKKNITKALKKDDGIKDFKIDVEGKNAKINFDKSKTDLVKIEKLITAAGYDANDKKSDPDAYANLDDCCKLPKDRKDKSSH